MFKSRIPSGLIGLLIFSPLLSFAYDLPLSRRATKPHNQITVALVPFSEQRTERLEKEIAEIRTELRKSKGIRLLNLSKTDEILRYYLRYVHRNTREDAIGKTITEARQALIEADFQKASQLLHQAAKKIEQRMAEGGTNEGLYQIHLLQAKIEHANRNDATIGRHYDKIVALYPTLVFDPNLYSHWERSALHAAKERTRHHQTAAIEITSAPMGSEVFLNGIHRGITPLMLDEVPAGRHVIEVKTVHHAPFLRQLSLQEGQKASLHAALLRAEGVEEDEHRRPAISPSQYNTDLEISRLISILGYHMGVDKIVLVTDRRGDGLNEIVYRLGDSRLGAVQKEHQTNLDSDQAVSRLAQVLSEEAQKDLLQDPAQYTNQAVGAVVLHEKRKRPFYKKPLFWVLVGAGAGTGGALTAILGATGAVTGGIVIGL